MTSDDTDPKEWSTELFGVEVSGCVSCNTLITGTESVCNKCSGKVPIEELEALADEWEETAESVPSLKTGAAYSNLAQELREVIDSYD